MGAFFKKVQPFDRLSLRKTPAAKNWGILAEMGPPPVLMAEVPAERKNSFAIGGNFLNPSSY